MAILLLCAGGLLINFLGVRLALGLKLPLFLDSIGCALSAALGGYIPGILVGFFTNVINGFGDYTTFYYGSLNALIAFTAAFFARKGYFRRLSKLPVIIVAFALIGGGLGSVLTWMLYGFDFGTGISAPLARRIFESGALNQFWSQFAADMLIDLADKTVTVAVVALVLKLMPEATQRRFAAYGWQGAAIPGGDAPKDGVTFNRRSMTAKIIALLTAALLIIVVVVTTISYLVFKEDSFHRKTAMARSALYVARDSIDAGRVDDYIRNGEAAEGYLQTKRRLEQLMHSADDIEYIYVYRILEEGSLVVFDLDAEGVPGSAPGTLEPHDREIQDRLEHFLAGEDIEPISSNGEYGWLLTAYAPIRDAEGVCQCYVAVDMDLRSVAVTGYQFLARISSLFLGFLVVVMTLAFWLVEYNVIWPVNRLAEKTEGLAFDSEEARQETVDSLKALDIRTGDEIESLYNAVVKTADDMVRYIASVHRQGEKIGRLQNGLILVLADMVESRDQCTGDHVRKTAAYTGIIMRRLREKGVYADQLTDEFIRDVENSAPLHDVGKIEVPDSILNKPGRLTDEEFAIMKKHAAAGRDIIARAMAAVSKENSGYLREAMTLAWSHHEKWDGTGYPQGLAGEDIPLSARIMAVADVFDALVSRRSYKEGFPFEKAMDIIREGAGTHFDPEVAAAFLESADEVRRVMDAYAKHEKP